MLLLVVIKLRKSWPVQDQERIVPRQQIGKNCCGERGREDRGEGVAFFCRVEYVPLPRIHCRRDPGFLC